MAELKPCPFCGGEAKIKLFKSGIFKRITVYYAECAVCGNQTKVQFETEQAIEAWNRRAQNG